VAGKEIDPRPWRRRTVAQARAGLCAAQGGERAVDERSGPDTGVEPALGRQLLEGLHHHAARHPEVCRQRPARRQPLPRPQPAVADRLSQAGLHLAPERRGTIAAADAQQELGTVIGLGQWQ